MSSREIALFALSRLEGVPRKDFATALLSIVRSLCGWSVLQNSLLEPVRVTVEQRKSGFIR
jgi:hypothetical protein